MIEKIERFGTKLQTESLVDFRSLVNAKVDGISTRTIEVATGQHVFWKWTEVGDPDNRVDIRAVKAGAEVKIVEGIRGAAGVRLGGPSFRMMGCLDRPHASREGVRAIKQRKWEATADRDDGGDRPSVQESLFHARHVPSERKVPGAGEYEAVTLVEIRVAFVNLGIERIEKPEICVVVGLAEGGAEIVDGVGIRIARMQA